MCHGCSPKTSMRSKEDIRRKKWFLVSDQRIVPDMLLGFDSPKSMEVTREGGQHYLKLHLGKKKGLSTLRNWASQLAGVHVTGVYHEPVEEITAAFQMNPPCRWEAGMPAAHDDADWTLVQQVTDYKRTVQELQRQLRASHLCIGSLERQLQFMQRKQEAGMFVEDCEDDHGEVLTALPNSEIDAYVSTMQDHFIVADSLISFIYKVATVGTLRRVVAVLKEANYARIMRPMAHLCHRLKEVLLCLPA